MTEQSTRDAVPERWNAAGPKSDMWMDPAQDPRFAVGAELEGERATLLDYLRAYRLALELKCGGLDAEQLARRSVPPSTMSLLGLIRHLADVERNWFRRVMAQADASPLYWSDDVEDADWAGAVADPAVVADAWRDWHEEVAFAEQFVAGSPDLAVRSPMQDGTTVALREVILHMVEEYARHLGHADLLRERIDGRVGQ
ncbi:MAG: DinB family protein [Streptosporangiaceae bacterium]